MKRRGFIGGFLALLGLGGKSTGAVPCTAGYKVIQHGHDALRLRRVVPYVRAGQDYRILNQEWVGATYQERICLKGPAGEPLLDTDGEPVVIHGYRYVEDPEGQTAEELGVRGSLYNPQYREPLDPGHWGDVEVKMTTPDFVWDTSQKD